LRIGGHCTSIRLEMSFWDTLEEIAAKEGMSLAKFLTRCTTKCSTTTARSIISLRSCAVRA
jgi:predicted DNA-binding ribbon-helix-helix protein